MSLVLIIAQFSLVDEMGENGKYLAMNFENGGGLFNRVDDLFEPRREEYYLFK